MYLKIFKTLPIVFLLLAFLIPQNAFAQVAGYGFTQTAGTYTAITGGTVLWSGTFDDEFSTAVTMPSFLFNGTNYTTIYISANGYATLGTVSLGYSPISTTTASPGVFSVFGRDLNYAASGTPEVRYQQVGSEFVIQWQDVRRYNVTGEIFSAQLRLNTSGNTIKFVYGGTITPGSYATYPQIGLRGATNADFKNRSILTGGGNWINSVAGATNTATMFFNSSDPTTVPSSGLTYTFSPPNYPPSIVYTPLLNTTSTGNRTLSNVVITDPDGIAISPFAPRVYWRVNGGAWSSSATASGSSPYSFTIGTTGLSIGDVVQYFVVAQDLLGAVGANPSAGFTATDVNTILTYPTTPNSYTIVDVPLSGSYTVGTSAFNMITGKSIYFEKVVNRVMKEIDVEVLAEKVTGADATESSLQPKTVKQLMEVEEITWVPMENGITYTGELFVKKIFDPQYNYPEGIDGIYATITAAVADLNLRGVSGAVSFLLTDATYLSETLPITVKINNANLPTASNTVTIKPNTGVTSLVQGASASSQIFKILNSYITIDGSNSGGTNRSLTIENTSVTTPQVLLIGSTGTTPIINVTVKNCNLINGVNTSSAVVITDGTVPGNPGYFNNITLQNCTVQKAYIGVYCNAVVTAGNGSGLLLTGNDLSTSGVNSVRFTGLYVQGVDGATLSNNTIANFDGVSSEDDRGVWFATGTRNSTIEKNYIHSLNYTGTGGYGAYGLAVSSGTASSNNTIKNNMIYNISGDAWGSSI